MFAYSTQFLIKSSINTRYMIIGTITHITTEYFTYSPKNRINCWDNIKTLSHQSEKDFTVNKIIAHPITNSMVLIGFLIMKSKSMHHDSGIIP